MSLCPISPDYTVEFTGTRADDGGQPEEVTVIASRYIDPIFVDPATYDKRLDDEMTFTFGNDQDGIYLITFVGNVSGLLQNQNLVVNHNAKNRIFIQGAKDMENLMCGKCSCSNYDEMIAILHNEVDLDSCLDVKNATDSLNTINNECGKQVICSCGCSG